MKLSDKAPKNWAEKRKEIDERIMKFTRSPNKEATIEEVDAGEANENNVHDDKTENNKPSLTKDLGRLNIGHRSNDIKKVLEYNILKRQSDDNIQTWKSYPGISKIIQISRKIIEDNNTNDIGELARMMQVHESQQSAAVVSTIAMLVGSKLNNSIDAKYREAIGDVILWDIPVIKEKKDWPRRRRYLPKMTYENEEDMKETK